MMISVHEIFILLNYLSIFIMVVCCFVIGSQSESRMQKLALLVCFSLTMCCLGFLFRSEATTADTFILGQKLVYVFVTHGMFLMLLFIVEYCRFSLPKLVRYCFHGVNLLISAAVLTLEYHPFFYVKYWAVARGGYVILEKDYGFLHTVAVVLFVTYMVAALAVTILYSVKNMRRKSKYVWRLLIAVMLPCIAYLIPKITGLNNDFQPLAFAAFSVMVLVMIYKNSLYDFDSIAARFSLAAMDEALIVFDNKYLYQGCNEKAETLFPVLKELPLDCDIRLESELLYSFLEGEAEEFKNKGKIYEVEVCPVKSGQLTLGKVVRLDDVTIQRQYTELLELSKQHLESEVATLSAYSYTDDLTGLKNRRSFEDKINEIRNGNNLENLIIGSVDLNCLKETNDSICHAAGDELLKAAAGILSEVFSAFGEVYRTGGDEFYIILEITEKTSADSIDIEDLISHAKELAAEWRGELVQELSFSEGFIEGKNTASENIDQMIIESDKAMYVNKRAFYEQSEYNRRNKDMV